LVPSDKGEHLRWPPGRTARLAKALRKDEDDDDEKKTKILQPPADSTAIKLRKSSHCVCPGSSSSSSYFINNRQPKLELELPGSPRVFFPGTSG
jgi:hypothetical protein